MKHLFVLFAALSISFLPAQELKIFNPGHNFVEGQEVAIFGDNTKLRSQANTQGEVIELLKIGTLVTVVEKTSKTHPFNGFSSPWYKVKYGNKTGYIVGGLLSLEWLDVDGQIFLFTYKKQGDQYAMLTRTIQKNGQYIQNESKLDNPQIAIRAFDNRGLKGVQNVILLDYYAEACGMAGGEMYLSYDGAKLQPILETTEVSEAGLFWHSETLIFPADTSGTDKLIFKQEFSEVLDEETNWVETKIVSRELEWKNGKIHPADFKK